MLAPRQISGPATSHTSLARSLGGNQIWPNMRSSNRGNAVLPKHAVYRGLQYVRSNVVLWLREKATRRQSRQSGYPATVLAKITYALRVALEWTALVLTVLIAVAIMLLASVLYSIIWFIRRLFEGL